MAESANRISGFPSSKISGFPANKIREFPSNRIGCAPQPDWATRLTQILAL